MRALLRALCGHCAGTVRALYRHCTSRVSAAWCPGAKGMKAGYETNFPGLPKIKTSINLDWPRTHSGHIIFKNGFHGREEKSGIRFFLTRFTKRIQTHFQFPFSIFLFPLSISHVPSPIVHFPSSIFHLPFSFSNLIFRFPISFFHVLQDILNS